MNGSAAIMPRYFFDLKNGHRLVDPAGLDCSDDADALAKAEVIARKIADEGSNSAGRKVAVIDVEGREIGKIEIGLGIGEN